MKNRGLTVAVFLMFTLTIVSNALYIKSKIEIRELAQQRDTIVKVMTSENITMQDKIQTIQAKYDDLNKAYNDLQAENKQLREHTDFLDRGDIRPVKRKMTVTAYDLSFQSCGKLPSNPEYGITASGLPVKEWYTVAAGPSIAFGTKVYIPFFKKAPNKGIFVVQDRGGAVEDNCIDVFMPDRDDCMEFGRQQLDVWVMR